MDNDKLKLFDTEEDVKNYAKVNGYGSKGTDALLSQWQEIKTNKKNKKVKKGSKKFGIFGAEDIETKD
tara:strand:+ start:293 stop:496 length:204 start_codon:yes stop_codon:yes gene_type:complete